MGSGKERIWRGDHRPEAYLRDRNIKGRGLSIFFFINIPTVQDGIVSEQAVDQPVAVPDRRALSS